MQSTFNLRRFGKLVRHNLQVLHPRYSTVGGSLVSAPLFPVLMVLMQLLMGMGTTNYGEPLYRLLLAVGFPFMMSFTLPGQLYSPQPKKGRGIYFALLPASKAEKYWSMYLVSVVIVPGVLAAGALALDTLIALCHVGPWQQFFWQIGPLKHPFTPWMLANMAVAILLCMAGVLWLSAFRNKVVVALGWIGALVWMTAGCLGQLVIWHEVAHGNVRWMAIFLAVQLAMLALVVWLGRRKLDRMTY